MKALKYSLRFMDFIDYYGRDGLFSTRNYGEIQKPYIQHCLKEEMLITLGHEYDGIVALSLSVSGYIQLRILPS